MRGDAAWPRCRLASSGVRSSRTQLTVGPRASACGVPCVPLGLRARLSDGRSRGRADHFVRTRTLPAVDHGRMPWAIISEIPDLALTAPQPPPTSIPLGSI